MSPLIARLKVIVTALPTYLAIVVLAAPMVAQSASEVLPTPWSQRVTALCLTAAAAAASAIALIRRVTPVINTQRGLLPPAGVIRSATPPRGSDA